MCRTLFCFQMLLIIPFPSSHRQTLRSGRIVSGIRGTEGNGLQSEFSGIVCPRRRAVGGRAEFRAQVWSAFPCGRLAVVSDSPCWNHCCEHHFGDSPCPWELWGQPCRAFQLSFLPACRESTDQSYQLLRDSLDLYLAMYPDNVQHLMLQARLYFHLGIWPEKVPGHPGECFGAG